MVDGPARGCRPHGAHGLVKIPGGSGQVWPLQPVTVAGPGRGLVHAHRPVQDSTLSDMKLQEVNPCSEGC